MKNRFYFGKPTPIAEKTIKSKAYFNFADGSSTQIAGPNLSMAQVRALSSASGENYTSIQSVTLGPQIGSYDSNTFQSISGLNRIYIPYELSCGNFCESQNLNTIETNKRYTDKDGITYECLNGGGKVPDSFNGFTTKWVPSELSTNLRFENAKTLYIGKNWNNIPFRMKSEYLDLPELSSITWYAKYGFQAVFHCATNLKRISIPELTSIPQYFFRNMGSSTKYLDFRGRENPEVPARDANSFYDVIVKIVVDDGKKEEWQQHADWQAISASIMTDSEYEALDDK